MGMNASSRIDNSIRNVKFGVIVVIINVAISFLTRLFLVKYLGIEYLGINGLFTEVISVISLAELGVGMAIVYSLYKPLYEQDYSKISGLMSLFKSTYQYISLGTFVIGILLLPFIHLLITDINFPINYIRLIFILFIINTSSSYLFSYKTALLNADQKQYIYSIFTIVIKIIISIFIIFVLILTKNYVLYLCLNITQVLLTNIFVSFYVDKHYPFIDYKKTLSKTERHTIFNNIKNIFIKRISGVVTTSTDNILISTMVSTIQVGFYSNYKMLFSPFILLRNQLANGITASIGNLSVVDTTQKNASILYNMTYIFFIYASVVSAVLFAISDSIITVWLGKDYVMNSYIVGVAIINLFLDIISVPLWQYLEVSGLFKQDKNIAIVGSFIKIAVSILLGFKYGIVGIFMGTICTQCVQIILKSILLFRKKFNLSPTHYFFVLSKCVLGILLISLFQFFIISNIIVENIYAKIIIYGGVATTAALIIASLLFAKTTEMKYLYDLIKTRIIIRINIKNNHA